MKVIKNNRQNYHIMDGYFFILIVTISLVTVIEATMPCSISLSKTIMYLLLIKITSFYRKWTSEGLPSLLAFILPLSFLAVK